LSDSKQHINYCSADCLVVVGKWPSLSS